MTGVALLAISGAERGIEPTAAQSRPRALRPKYRFCVYRLESEWWCRNAAAVRECQLHVGNKFAISSRIESAQTAQCTAPGLYLQPTLSR